MNIKHRQTKKMTKAMVAELLDLRKSGWSSLRLGEKFGIDHTTVLYWCKKAKLKNPTKLIPVGKGGLIGKRVFEPPKAKNYGLLPQEKINQGKFYLDYLKIEAEKGHKKVKDYLKYL